MVYNVSIMKKRTNYNLNEDQHQILRIAAAYRGISASKLLRQVIDEWIKANAQNIQISDIPNRETDNSN